MFSVRKAISRTFLAVSMAYDLLELYVYCLLVFAWLFAVFFGFSAPCGSSNRKFYDVQENYDIYEDEAILEPQTVVPSVRAAFEEPNEVNNFREPDAESLATSSTTHEAIHLEVPLVIEDASEPFCHFGFASNNGSDLSVSSLSSIEIVDTPTPSPGGNRRGDRDRDASRDLNSSQLRPLLLSTQTVEPRNKRAPLLRVDAPAFVPASRSSPGPGRRASGSENVPLPPSAYWNPPPNSAIPIISVPYKRPRRRGGRTPVISEREIRERAARLGTKALQPVKI